MARKKYSSTYTEKLYFDNTIFSGIIASTDAHAEGTFKHLVNFDISDTGQSITPRKGFINTTMILSDGAPSVLTMSDPIYFKDATTGDLIFVDFSKCHFMDLVALDSDSFAYRVPCDEMEYNKFKAHPIENYGLTAEAGEDTIYLCDVISPSNIVNLKYVGSPQAQHTKGTDFINKYLIKVSLEISQGVFEYYWIFFIYNVITNTLLITINNTDNIVAKFPRNLASPRSLIPEPRIYITEEGGYYSAYYNDPEIGLVRHHTAASNPDYTVAYNHFDFIWAKQGNNYINGEIQELTNITLEPEFFLKIPPDGYKWVYTYSFPSSFEFAANTKLTELKYPVRYLDNNEIVHYENLYPDDYTYKETWSCVLDQEDNLKFFYGNSNELSPINAEEKLIVPKEEYLISMVESNDLVPKTYTVGVDNYTLKAFIKSIFTDSVYPTPAEDPYFKTPQSVLQGEYDSNKYKVVTSEYHNITSIVSSFDSTETIAFNTIYTPSYYTVLTRLRYRLSFFNYFRCNKYTVLSYNYVNSSDAARSSYFEKELCDSSQFIPISESDKLSRFIFNNPYINNNPNTPYASVKYPNGVTYQVTNKTICADAGTGSIYKASNVELYITNNINNVPAAYNNGDAGKGYLLLNISYDDTMYNGQASKLINISYRGSVKLWYLGNANSNAINFALSDTYVFDGDTTDIGTEDCTPDHKFGLSDLVDYLIKYYMGSCTIDVYYFLHLFSTFSKVSELYNNKGRYPLYKYLNFYDPTDDKIFINNILNSIVYNANMNYYSIGVPNNLYNIFDKGVTFNMSLALLPNEDYIANTNLDYSLLCQRSYLLNGTTLSTNIGVIRSDENKYITLILTKDPTNIANATQYCIFKSVEGDRLVVWIDNIVYMSEADKLYYFLERYNFPEEVYKVVPFKDKLLVFTSMNMYAIYPYEETRTQETTDEEGNKKQVQVKTVTYNMLPVLYNIYTDKKYLDAIKVYNSIVLFYSITGQLYLITPSATIDSDTVFTIKYLNQSANDILLNYTTYINDRLAVYNLSSVTKDDIDIRVTTSLSYIKIYYLVSSRNYTYILLYDITNNRYTVYDTITYGVLKDVFNMNYGELIISKQVWNNYITLVTVDTNKQYKYLIENGDQTYYSNCDRITKDGFTFDSLDIHTELDTGILYLNNHLKKRTRNLHVLYKNLDASEIYYSLDMLMDDIYVNTVMSDTFELSNINDTYAVNKVSHDIDLLSNRMAVFDFSAFSSNNIISHSVSIPAVGKNIEFIMRFHSKGKYKLIGFGLIYKEHNL